MRLGIVQFGDYRDAYDRFGSGGPETYYAQRYSVDFVANLSERLEFVGVVSALGGEPYEAMLTEQLASARINLGPKGGLDSMAVAGLLERWRIDHLLLQSPDLNLIHWALRRRIKTLPVFADSWQVRDVASYVRAKQLAFALSSPKIPIIGNHNVPASLSLEAIGVDARKIFPWDWPHALTPHQHQPKILAGDPLLVFVGALIETKGAGDCIKAAAILRDRGVRFRMALIGGGDYEPSARALIESFGLGERVALRGRLPNGEVVAILKQAALSLVPSWSAYPEGLPMTIYEALATRTPIILSDHPMFRRFFTHAACARIAPEQNPQALADAAASLLSSPAAYQTASQATAAVWETVRCDLAWGDLVAAWIDDPDAPQTALRGRSLKHRLSVNRPIN